MNTLADRLRESRKARDLTQREVASAADMTQSAYSDLENGRSQTSTKIAALARALQVDAFWLQTGEQPGITPVSLSSGRLAQIEPWDDETPLEDDEVEIPFYKDFKFACGHGKLGNTMGKETRRLRISKLTLRNRNIEFTNASAATVTDNSMSPTINDGATILIDCGKNEIKNGQIFIIRQGEGEFAEFRCKRLYRLPMGGVRIVSDNSEEYPEERLSLEEIKEQNFTVLGWVFSVQQLFSW